MDAVLRWSLATRDGLEWIGRFLPQLALRLLLAYEFWVAGWGKLTGDNWFEHIQADFPFPFSVLPVGLSWFIATWAELLGALMLALGLGTRIAAGTLVILVIVAWYSVHAGLGYNVADNGWLLPLWMLLMLFVPLFNGAGTLSLDHWLYGRMRAVHSPNAGRTAVPYA